MLRRFLDFHLSFVAKGKKLSRFRPLISALDTFAYEAPINTTRAPHVRDAVDIKRWMMLVVIALFPAIFMSIWNTGLQKMVYESGNTLLMKEYLTSSQTAAGYFDFVFKEGRYLTILGLGALAFLPLMLISYLVGGLCEGIFAVLYQHEIAEGFLVTGMLYPLILPPTMPYWMAALGIAFGVVVGKELFGGTGMNILNPALTARAFLFFTFPGKMTGDIWVGTNPVRVAESLKSMNTQAGLSPDVDGFTQATPLGALNILPTEVKRIHVEAIAANQGVIPQTEGLTTSFDAWKASSGATEGLGSLPMEEMRTFLTSSTEGGGLGLLPENFGLAYRAVDATYGTELWGDGNLFFGNMLGSMGETSVFACLLGALFLIFTRVGSWRSMVGCVLGAFVTAYLFQFFSTFGEGGGLWNPARYAVPAYRHLLMGGLAFGLVFMVTDPVSSPGMRLSRWIYGALIGAVTILIRIINPAYPEGVMLAILFGNVFAPLIDYHVVRHSRRRVIRDRQRQLA